MLLQSQDMQHVINSLHNIALAISTNPDDYAYAKSLKHIYAKYKYKY